ncbi:hypothetical protein CEP50_16280 [Actinopolyspora mortivallis]|uniref:Uncharacterized protein n=1 Tax=Actinopolyspora mortivallis TaxID=33906 RepID=A0A2T0GT69_ACTMO|nr:hypothetical protein CEP50_16280 [Actinopolyspora mortivallis]
MNRGLFRRAAKTALLLEAATLPVAAATVVIVVRAPVALLVSAGVAAVPDEPTPPWCPLS